MKKKSTIYQLTTCALFTALMCIFGPMSVPIGPVPVSLTNLIIYISVFLLGMKGSLISVAAYLVLGAVGLPVFSGYSGGLAKLTGPTGGYLVGFLFIALIAGFVAQRSKANVWFTGLALIVATAVLYFFGTVWFVIMMNCEIGYALGVCVYPFLVFDLAKIVIACLLGQAARIALMKAQLLPDQK